jgi:TatD DNase family protein
MIDTHAHVNPSKSPFDKGDLNDFKIGELDFVILSAANMETSISNVELAKIDKRLLAAVGIHPRETITNYELSITNLEKLLKENQEIIAVGECGLDYSNLPKSPFDKGDFQEMEVLFRQQIELAKKYNKPLIVHARKAVEEVFDILRGSNTRGVVHCYTGGKKRVQKVLDLGKDWFFGIDGNVTYEEGLVEVVKVIPHERLLAETDSPELTPLPFRGQKNSPENVKYVYQKIAEIWGMSFDETEKILDENARRLFLQ